MKTDELNALTIPPEASLHEAIDAIDRSKRQAARSKFDSLFRD